MYCSMQDYEFTENIEALLLHVHGRLNSILTVVMYDSSLWCIRKDEDEGLSLTELLESDSGRWTVALELVATVFMLPFMYIGAHLPHLNIPSVKQTRICLHKMRVDICQSACFVLQSTTPSPSLAGAGSTRRT